MTKTTAALEQELTELRAALAALGGAAAPTVTEAVTDPTAPAVGSVIHVLKPVLLGGEVRPRGMVLEVTEALLAGTVDRNGKSSLRSLIDAEAIGEGDWPEGVRKWVAVADRQWSYEYLRALAHVRSIIDPDERRRAKAAMEREYGMPPQEWADRNLTPQQSKRSKWSY